MVVQVPSQQLQSSHCPDSQRCVSSSGAIHPEDVQKPAQAVFVPFRHRKNAEETSAVCIENGLWDLVYPVFGRRAHCQNLKKGIKKGFFFPK